MRKKTYYDTELEIIRFDSEDIITESLSDEETSDDNTEGDF